MGLYPIEQAVLELADRGIDSGVIACRLGVKKASVISIRARFNVDPAKDAAADDALRAQTARLGELVREAGGHR
ncbi:hypothetical protein ACLBKU_16010 [Erythrobacter sp. NE805]|uniref:hypothetical protein n=1 Tax=Erythrobacter sp. NE805 TaxID=3389875 RepID=UPI00396B2A20